MLKILGRPNSINVRKVLWAAEEIGVPYEREDWGRGFRPTSDPGFARLSPFGVVPVVIDDGVVLRESNTIVRYLAAKHARDDLYPADLGRRAAVEAWMDWGATDLYDGVRPVFHGHITKLEPYGTNRALVAEGEALWADRMQLLESQLAAGGPYLAGSSFTIADIPVGLIVNRWFAVPFAKPELPAIAAYYDRLSTREAYRRHGRNGMP